MAAKIKKGDRVVVLTGRDKGKTGEVLQVLPEANRAIVQGVNVVRRHTRQTASQESGIYSKEAPIHVSNIALADRLISVNRLWLMMASNGQARSNGNMMSVRPIARPTASANPCSLS